MKDVTHDTWQGYKQHRYRKETACDACKKAWREYCYEKKEQRERT